MVPRVARLAPASSGKIMPNKSSAAAAPGADRGSGVSVTAAFDAVLHTRLIREQTENRSSEPCNSAAAPLPGALHRRLPLGALALNLISGVCWRLPWLERSDTFSSDMPTGPLICNKTVSRVSSVLNRDAKQFGKKHMFDGSEETCWNSDQGSSQWVMLEFPQPVKVSQLQIQFQGGFASQLCTLEGGRKGEELVKISDFYPEDINALQSFRTEETMLDKLKITFENSTDFFGRIIVYRLSVLGEKL
uniref:Nuclear receptor 2C2-associated protein n=1 Tax=Gopherus agassizii TaxID=38772 RepID=A0A452GII8_9SAUR